MKILSAEDAEVARRTQKKFGAQSAQQNPPRPLRNLRALCAKKATIVRESLFRKS